MAYIGKTPVIGNFQVCDAISVVDAQAAYTMQVGGVNVSPESANHMLVSLNGILQAPTTSFTVSGSTITFASALETGDVIDFIQILGNVLDLGVPSDNTVSLAKLTATGTKDATTFLRGDNTFAGAGITMADSWRLTTDFTGDANPISSNLERVDTDGYGQLGTGMSESSGTFTFPQTGIYFIIYQASFLAAAGSGAQDHFSELLITTDNSSYNTANNGWTHTSGGQRYTSTVTHHILDVTDTSNVKVRLKVNVAAADTTTSGATDVTITGVTFIRLGDT
jgi:hypothetical protein